VRALAFSSEGSPLAVGGANGTLRMWDTEGQQLLGSDLPTPGGEIRSLAFAEDGGPVCVGGPHVPLQCLTAAPDQARPNHLRPYRGGLTEGQWRTHVPDTPSSLCAPIADEKGVTSRRGGGWIFQRAVRVAEKCL
jgi:hypothetical protein